MSPGHEETPRRSGAGLQGAAEEDWDSRPVVGLTMTPAERLRWLEETVEELRKVCGAARTARLNDP